MGRGSPLPPNQRHANHSAISFSNLVNPLLLTRSRETRSNVKPESAGSDHETENDQHRAVGSKLAVDPPLALVQQVATELVDLPLKSDVTGIGRAGSPVVPVVCPTARHNTGRSGETSAQSPLEPIPLSRSGALLATAGQCRSRRPLSARA